MECVVWYFVGGDVRGYFAGCFSKVEDNVAFIMVLTKRKNRLLAECFSFPSF